MAEHGTHVPHALAAVVQQVVFDGGAHQAGGTFGAQGQLFAVELVFKGVHLLFHNVRHLADAAHEQLGVLHDRCAHIAVGKAPHQIAHLRFQPFPARGFTGQDVIHAFDGGEFFGLCHFVVLSKRQLLKIRAAYADLARFSDSFIFESLYTRALAAIVFIKPVHHPSGAAHRIPRSAGTP